MDVAISTWGHNGDWGWKEVGEGPFPQVDEDLAIFLERLSLNLIPLDLAAVYSRGGLARVYTHGQLSSSSSSLSSSWSSSSISLFIILKECIHRGNSDHHHWVEDFYSLFIDTALKTCTSLRPSQSLIIRNRTLHEKETETPFLAAIGNLLKSEVSNVPSSMLSDWAKFLYN